MERKSPFLNFSAKVTEEELDMIENDEPRQGRSLKADELEKKWRAMSESEKKV